VLYHRKIICSNTANNFAVFLFSMFSVSDYNLVMSVFNVFSFRKCIIGKRLQKKLARSLQHDIADVNKSFLEGEVIQ